MSGAEMGGISFESPEEKAAFREALQVLGATTVKPQAEIADPDFEGDANHPSEGNK